MERAVYVAESALEATHWWFRGRRRLFAALIRRKGVPAEARVLDLGTGCGSNLRMLQDLGMRRVIGIDRSQDAAGFASEKVFAPVAVGDARKLPFGRAAFDLVLATDVIEHVEDDVAALKEVLAVLRPGGAVLITVPAFPSLWGKQDEIAHHCRRYRRPGLRAAVAGAGLVVEESFHFNFVLFPLIWAARMLLRPFAARYENENNLTPGALNTLLDAVFAFDVSASLRLRPPFGVSLCVWASKPA